MSVPNLGGDFSVGLSSYANLTIVLAASNNNVFQFLSGKETDLHILTQISLTWLAS